MHGDFGTDFSARIRPPCLTDGVTAKGDWMRVLARSLVNPTAKPRNAHGGRRAARGRIPPLRSDYWFSFLLSCEIGFNVAMILI